MSKIRENTNATNHYEYYPDDQWVPKWNWLAYGFRPIFLVLAPYMIISMGLWGLVWSGMINISFMNDTLTWHIYEMLFGIATAGIMAFLFTGLPELFPGWVPVVGWRLAIITLWWVLGRISFWMVDIIGVPIVAGLNLSLLVWILWHAKDVVLDPLQRHASLAYTLVAIFVIESWFFMSMAGMTETSGMEILKVATGAFVVLTLLALRRVNMEAINEIMEDEEIDDVFIAPPPSYNLPIFAVIIFTVVEFLYPENSILGWLGLAVAAATLGILNDYVLKDESIYHLPYIYYLGLVPIMISLGYGFMGYALLTDGEGINHYRHFITSGGIGLAYMMVMIIVSYVHTGRQLIFSIWTHLMVGFIILATFMRALIPFFEEYTSFLYLASSIVWVLPFFIYIGVFFKFLVKPRADGVKG